MVTKIQTDTVSNASDRQESMIRAYDAIVALATSPFRMAGNVRPFSKTKERFNHIYRAGTDNHLSLCGGMAVVRTHKLGPLYLPDVHCVACLNRYAEILRDLRTYMDTL